MTTRTTSEHRRTAARLDHVLPALVALLVLFALTTIVRGDEIVVRSAIRLDPGADVVRLSDIARLDGEYAATLGDLVVARVPADGTAIEITIDRIVGALRDANANQARFALRGRDVIVRPMRGADRATANRGVTPIATKTEATAATDPRVEPADLLIAPAQVVGEDSARGLIAQSLANEWRPFQGEAQVRVRSTVAGDLGPMNGPCSVRRLRDGATGAVFEIARASDGRRLGTAIAVVEIRHGRAIARRPIERGETIDSQAIRIEHTWIPARVASTMPAPESFIGQTVARAVRHDQPIRVEHLAPIVRRGEMIVTRLRVGALEIEQDMVALEDARLGETIDCVSANDPRPLRSRERTRTVIEAPGLGRLLD